MVIYIIFKNELLNSWHPFSNWPPQQSNCPRVGRWPHAGKDWVRLSALKKKIKDVRSWKSCFSICQVRTRIYSKLLYAKFVILRAGPCRYCYWNNLAIVWCISVNTCASFYSLAITLDNINAVQLFIQNLRHLLNFKIDPFVFVEWFVTQTRLTLLMSSLC